MRLYHFLFIALFVQKKHKIPHQYKTFCSFFQQLGGEKQHFFCDFTVLSAVHRSFLLLKSLLYTTGDTVPMIKKLWTILNSWKVQITSQLDMLLPVIRHLEKHIPKTRELFFFHGECKFLFWEHWIKQKSNKTSEIKSPSFILYLPLNQ